MSRVLVQVGLIALAGLLAGCGGNPEPSITFPPGVISSSSPGPSTRPSASAAEPSASPVRPTPAPADVGVEVVAEGLVAPDGLVAAPDDSGRSFVLDQTGKVFILRDGKVLPQPFLDLSSKVVPLNPDYDERGLLGLAFDPDYADTGRVYAYYTANVRGAGAKIADHTDTLSVFMVSATDPDRVDPASERTILQFDQPQANHNGGGLGFGPDGDLYLGVGDGGNEGDIGPGHSPGGNAQDRTKFNGKILRLDVHGAAAYTIPSDNPFVRVLGRPEIYAYGLRNPWRFSWEPTGQHRFLVDDVGWGRYEEVDVVTAGGNYGWPIREGAHCLDVQEPLAEVPTCATTGKGGDALIDPVLEYRHNDIGIAIVGGSIYEGSAIAGLAGRYVFADLSKDWTTATPVGRGTLMAAVPDAGVATWEWRKLSIQGGPRLGFIAGMGQDSAGEIYLLTRDQLGPVGTTGRILKVVPGG